MARRAPLTDGLVEFRDGVHLRGTLLWFDAARMRELCVLSHALVPGSRKHRQFVTTAETARLLGLEAGDVLLARPERPFTVGKLRLELMGSGYLLGSASALVDHGGQRVLYAGDVNPEPRQVSSRFVQRACDTLVLEARFGHPRYRFPARQELHTDLLRFVAAAHAERRTPALLVAPLGLAQEVAQLLGAAGSTLSASRRIAGYCDLYRELGVAQPEVREWRGRPRPDEVLLWPLGAPLPRALHPATSRLALLSGHALDPEVRRRVGADLALPLSDHADHPQLLEYVASSGARRVYLTGLHAAALSAELRSRGLVAETLGPPEQMDLFRG